MRFPAAASVEHTTSFLPFDSQGVFAVPARRTDDAHSIWPTACVAATMVLMIFARYRGVVYAVAAAALFGVSTPFAKLLLRDLSATLLAGLLYLGSGIGLGLWALFRLRREKQTIDARLKLRDIPWLVAIVICGGVLGPLLAMWGLARATASTASLLLNLEGVFTALLAWFVFRENFDRRIALGMLAIVAGGAVLSWGGAAEASLRSLAGPLAISGACLCWALDNNLTRKLSASDPVQIAAIKGLFAGLTNSAMALLLGAGVPNIAIAASAGSLGFVSYGLSLVLFILALRHLGSARTGAYFSTAPFIGAALSIALLGDSLTWTFIAAAGLMAVGFWLHVTEQHSHAHDHPFLEHEHWHDHDEHHQHEHPPGIDPHGPHSHPHVHQPLRHTHPHYPDIHHQHGH